MNILVIQGPNINLLGIRRPDIYGSLTMEEINSRLRCLAHGLGCQITFFHSNHEGDIVDEIQRAMGKIDYLIINAAALTHTSIAIRDAIEAIDLPAIEVHLSNIHARDDFRHKSMLAAVCRGQISGFGYLSYEMALRIAVEELKGANI